MCDLKRKTTMKEIHKTFSLCNFFTRRVGYNFIDDLPNTTFGHLKRWITNKIALLMFFLILCTDINYVFTLVIRSSSVADFVSNLHLVGFDVISFAKLVTIWYKSNAFRRLINKLVHIWLIFIQDEEANNIKRSRTSCLRTTQLCYVFINILAFMLYNVRPVIVYLYHTMQGMHVDFGTVWHITYPFEITTPIFHLIFFLLETYAGVVSACSMLGYDILFVTMTNHITVLLRLLQIRIRRLGKNLNSISDLKLQHCDCYEEIKSIVKTHQHLIKFVTDLENAFTGVNLINIFLSSVNICCAFFNITLDPWLSLDNKLFLCAALTQVGILCWYADEIYTSSTGIAEALYESAWYKCNKRCQQAFLIILQRSQKPLHFTALKFHSITISTYRKILTSSYSYFTLLYTLYHNN